MAEDKELAANLKVAKTKPMFFAVIAKGNEGKLLVDKKKILSKICADAKKQLGGGTIFSGRVQGEDGLMVFEVGKQPPPTLAALTKKIMKRDGNLAMDVEYRVAADLSEQESAETEGAEQSNIPPAPPLAPPAPVSNDTGPSANDVIKRLNAMTAAIKAAMAGPNKAAVQTRFLSVNTALKNKDYAGANATLDELEPLLQGAAPKGNQGQAPQGTGKLSIVKLGKARIEWGNLRSRAVSDIATLKSKLQEEFGSDAEQTAQLGAALKTLDGTISQLNDNLGLQLDAVLNAKTDNERAALAGTAKATMQQFQRYVDSDTIIAELDGNEVMPDMLVIGPLKAKLQEIAAALG
jgi:hypothetical protein